MNIRKKDTKETFIADNRMLAEETNGNVQQSSSET